MNGFLGRFAREPVRETTARIAAHRMTRIKPPAKAVARHCQKPPLALASLVLRLYRLMHDSVRGVGRLSDRKTMITTWRVAIV